MAKKTVKKITKKRSVKKSSSAKTVTKPKKKSTVSKSSTHKKKSTSRSEQCILVCGKDRCVEACKPVTGECIPCPFCGHGHFCDDDFVCQSCGATRELVVRPYKGE